MEKIDKSQWGDGPWQSEPDKRFWTHNGFACLILRAPNSGALCGYLGVLPDHPWHGKDYDRIECECHGGLTFSALPNDRRVFIPEGKHPDEAAFIKQLTKEPGDFTTLGVYADWLTEQSREDEARLLRNRSNIWWIGFDCAHAFDLCPGFDWRHRHLQNEHYDVYRTFSYVVSEVERMARQAEEAMNKENPIGQPD